MATLTPVSPTTAHTPAEFTSASDSVLNDNSTDTWAGDNTNADYTHAQGYALADITGVDTDFGNMASLTIEYEFGRDANGADKQWLTLAARVLNSAQTGVLAGAGSTLATSWQTLESTITTTTPTTGNAAFAFVSTGSTGSVWDAGIVEFQIAANRDKGGAGDEFRVYDINYTGTYTTATVPAPVYPPWPTHRSRTANYVRM